jgi:hypothetical protein
MVGMEHEPNHVLITIMLSPVPVDPTAANPRLARIDFVLKPAP